MMGRCPDRCGAAQERMSQRKASKNVLNARLLRTVIRAVLVLAKLGSAARGRGRGKVNATYFSDATINASMNINSISELRK